MKPPVPLPSCRIGGMGMAMWLATGVALAENPPSESLSSVYYIKDLSCPGQIG
jgi:hypothetical protein